MSDVRYFYLPDLNRTKWCNIIHKLTVFVFALFYLQTGTLTEGRPTVSAVASLGHEQSEILQIAAAVEKTASHPLAKAIIAKAESLNLSIPSTRGQLAEPGSGTLAEVDGLLVAVGKLSWVCERFQQRTNLSDIKKLEQSMIHQLSADYSPSNHSRTTVFVGREGEGVIGAISISDNLRHDAESTITRYCCLFLTILLKWY